VKRKRGEYQSGYISELFVAASLGVKVAPRENGLRHCVGEFLRLRLELLAETRPNIRVVGRNLRENLFTCRSRLADQGFEKSGLGLHPTSMRKAFRIEDDPVMEIVLEVADEVSRVEPDEEEIAQVTQQLLGVWGRNRSGAL
jgi:hypothetical protein